MTHRTFRIDYGWLCSNQGDWMPITGLDEELEIRCLPSDAFGSVHIRGAGQCESVYLPASGWNWVPGTDVEIRAEPRDDAGQVQIRSCQPGSPRE